MRYAQNCTVACGFFEADHHFPVPLPYVGDEGEFPGVFAKIRDAADFFLFLVLASLQAGGGDRRDTQEDGEEEEEAAKWGGHRGG